MILEYVNDGSLVALLFAGILLAAGSLRRPVECVSCSGCAEGDSSVIRLVNRTVLAGLFAAGILYMLWRVFSG